MAETTVVLHYRRTATYGLNVLLAAVEQELGPEPGLDLRLARGLDETVAASAEALAAGRRVLVAWSFYSPEVPVVAAELARCRAELGPAALHVVGGVHATAEPAATLALGFDLLIAGEGEEPFVRLLVALRDDAPLDDVPGLVRPASDGSLLRNPPAPRHPLGRFPPFPVVHGRFNPIEITRGCVYACSFCQTPSMFKARFRHRPVEDVRRYAGLMLATGRRDVRFLTPTCLSYGSEDESVRLDAVEALLAGVRDEIADRGRIFFGTFPSEVRPEHVTPEALAVIRRYCDNDNLVIGGQSGSEAMLAATNRGHGVEVIVDACRIAVESGFVPNVDMLFGLPGETPTDVAATLALAQRLADLGARVHGHTFMPLPGTALRDAPPGRLDDETRVRLDRLASQGAAYGSWRRQEEVAAAMVAVRPTRRRRRGPVSGAGG
ncbi:MAG: TIGR04013 family B12-binding domain/radical SAM domain-containing protein [Acidimicrobiales bacterium]|nr:TIGR04013 family B12-binding domain/radical SAM domain-containing protein [Acidimicrobiales bacterium]